MWHGQTRRHRSVAGESRSDRISVTGCHSLTRQRLADMAAPRLSRSSCASSGEKPPGISVATVLSCTVAAADQSATALQLQYITDNIRTGGGFCIIQQFPGSLPPVLQSNGNRGRIHTGPDIVRLISSYCVLQLVRDHPCSSARTCTGAPRPASPASKTAARVVPPARKTGQMMTVMETPAPPPENRFQIMLLNNTRPRDNQLPTVAGV